MSWPCQQLMLLLVVLLLSDAHARSVVTSPFTGTNTLLLALGDATKALQAAKENLEDASMRQYQQKSQPATSTIVVQDWSLVCKELCGAGLSVTPSPCASECAGQVALPGPTLAPAPRDNAAILSPEFGLAICENLCKLKLGGVQCTCNVSEAPPPPTTLQATNDVLYYQTHTSFSPQQLSHVIEAGLSQNVAAHGSELRTVSAQPSSDVDPTASDPDWNEMCKVLCSTGDGGSLCNCDLTPFIS
ncbi:uncharacterized protein LOC115622495 [Scaptodrosophila lebanonensis]|uniref:Uncharacterized protein LOC115622495 n=1 Tax=Drosophila lebanonensis TaxID=7225 RepID=A0A6J2T5V7_DROLE|nr:uncharacterized protein LOC115622495 [Scaptodrosophila lebanonensis]